MDWLQTDYYFSGQQTGCLWIGHICELHFEKIVKCIEGNEENESGLRACCRNQSLPHECSGYCTLKQVKNVFDWRCGEWIQQVTDCSERNDGYVCCEEQGVPKDCCIRRNQQK